MYSTNHNDKTTTYIFILYQCLLERNPNPEKGYKMLNVMQKKKIVELVLFFIIIIIPCAVSREKE